MTVIDHRHFDGGVIHENQFGSVGDAAFAKAEGTSAGGLLVLFGCFFVLDFVAFGFYLFEALDSTGNLSDAFKKISKKTKKKFFGAQKKRGLLCRRPRLMKQNDADQTT